MANDIPIIGATVVVVKNIDGTHDYVGPTHPLNTTSDLTVDGQKVDDAHPVPTTAAVTFPSAMTTTDSGVRRMQALTWEAGASVSNLVNLGDRERISSILIPISGWAATATRIYVDSSDDGSTWYPLHDLAGNLIYAQVGASAATFGVGLTDDERARISRKYVRFKSTTDAGAAVTMAAAVSCQLGSMNASSANPYSTWSFRVAAGGSISAEVTVAGRVTWAVSDGTGTVTTIGSTLTLSGIAKTVDVVCTAAFAFAGSYINISSGTGVSFALSALPDVISKLRMSTISGALTGSIDDLSKTLTYLIITTISGSTITGSIANLSQYLTMLNLTGIAGSVLTGSINDLSKILTSITIGSLSGSTFTGELRNLSRVLVSLTVYSQACTFTGSLNDLPKSLTLLNLTSLSGSTFTGSLNDLAKTLTSLTLSGLASSTLSGSLNDLSKTLTSMYLSGLTGSTFSGSLNDLSKTMTSLYLFGLASSTFTGALATELPTTLTGALWLYDLPAGVTGAFTTANIGAANKNVKCYNAGFSATDTDNMLINLEAVGSSTGVAVFETNRTSASDAALTALQGRGWTVTFA